MNKLFSITIIAICALSFTSCTKNSSTGTYHCICSLTYNGTNTTNDTISTVSGVTQSSAQTSCTALGQNYAPAMGYSNVLCNVK